MITTHKVQGRKRYQVYSDHEYIGDVFCRRGEWRITPSIWFNQKAEGIRETLYIITGTEQ